MKYCPKCELTKNKDEFGICKSKYDGLQSYCRVCKREIQRNWNYKHNESEKERKKLWSRANLGYYKQWRLNNKDIASKYSKSEKGKLTDARKRHKRKTNENATLTLQEWNLILKECNYTCLSCMRKFNSELKPEKDHIIPLSKGGTLSYENTQALCKSCNSSKNNKYIDYIVYKV